MSRVTTTRVVLDGEHTRLFRRKFALHVLDGPDRGRSVTTSKETVTVGSASQNDLVLSDPAVSRHHLRVEATPGGFQLTDLDSSNGTTVGDGDLELGQILAHGAVDLRLGQTRLRFTPLAEEEDVPIPNTDRFGDLIGVSPAMRELFQTLESVSQ